MTKLDFTRRNEKTLSDGRSRYFEYKSNNESQAVDSYICV